MVREGRLLRARRLQRARPSRAAPSRRRRGGGVLRAGHCAGRGVRRTSRRLPRPVRRRREIRRSRAQGRGDGEMRDRRTLLRWSVAFRVRGMVRGRVVDRAPRAAVRLRHARKEGGLQRIPLAPRRGGARGVPRRPFGMAEGASSEHRSPCRQRCSRRVRDLELQAAEHRHSAGPRAHWR